jgi:CRISPR-associated protein Cas2
MPATHASEAPLFAVCYDISDDRERRRVDKLLLGYGYRRQYSVFECRLNTAARRRLQQQLEWLGLKTGHVRLYRVAAGGHSTVVGVPPPDPDAVHCYTL